MSETNPNNETTRLRLRVRTSLPPLAEGELPADGDLVWALPRQDLPSIGMLSQVQYEIRRLEAFLAFAAGLRVPFGARFEGDPKPFEYEFEHTWPLSASERVELRPALKGVYATACHLLSVLSAESYLGKAVECVGRSFVTEDQDAMFVDAWNGVELLSKGLHVGDTGVGSAVLPPGGFPKVSKLVPVALSRYHDDIDDRPTPDPTWLEKLRNGSAHGGLSDPPGASLEEFSERWDKAVPIRNLSREMIVNYLSEKGLVGLVNRPFRSGGWVHWDGRLEPVDDAPRLAHRGTGWD